MKRALTTLVLCVLMATPAVALPRDSDGDGFIARVRDRIVRIARVVTHGDALTPPLPAPRP